MTRAIAPSNLLLDISTLIEKAKQHISEQFNTTYVMLAWNIGTRISREILDHKRAAYGKSVMESLARDLQLKYGQGFDKTSLSRMVKFLSFTQNVKLLRHCRINCHGRI